MARLDTSYLPHGNPCAQCGKPIARPDWGDYRFEAVAIYEEADPDALAA